MNIQKIKKLEYKKMDKGKIVIEIEEKLKTWKKIHRRTR